MPHDPLQIADRMGLIEASGIRKFFDLSQSMKNPINLSIGQADYEPPAEVVSGAIEAMQSGRNRYSVTQGIEPLRARVRSELEKTLPISDHDSVMLTSGVSGGLMLSLMVTLNPGDEVLIPDPYFVMYKHLANAIGAKPVTYSIFPDFAITRASLEAACTERTRVLLVNSPANPTGYVITEAEARLVADFARERGLLLVSDEIYDAFTFDRPHISPRRFYDKTLVLGGFSKNFGVPGWRLGYACGPEVIMEQMRILQQFSFVCAPTPLQWGVLKGMDQDFSEHREAYRIKRDIIYHGLKDDFTCIKPEGAFYMFPQLPEGISSGAFVERCIEHNILVVPGSACSTRDRNIRISFACDDETLKRGVDGLLSVVRSFR